MGDRIDLKVLVALVLRKASKPAGVGMGPGKTVVGLDRVSRTGTRTRTLPPLALPETGTTS